MYHSRFKGTHYETGFRYGQLLYNHGKILNSCPTFPIDESRIEFAKKCIRKIEPIYPEIIEEAKGLAKGNNIEFDFLSALIFSMYCYDTDVHCSCFADNNGTETVFGRNSDFLVSIEKLYMNVLYKLDNVYSFNGNTTAFIEIEDGVNEHGLAVGLTFVPIRKIKPGFNVGIIVRYLLEKCKTVNEAINKLQELPIASGGTLTLADKTGSIAMVELSPNKIVVKKKRKGYVYSTNIFTSKELEKLNIKDFDNWKAKERYETFSKAFKENKTSISFSKNVLKGEYGFMCQYDRSKNADTVWSVVYNLTSKEIYRCEGNPRRKTYKLDTR